MRALFNNNFKSEGYIFGKKGFKVKPEAFFTMSKANAEGLKTVKLLDKIDVFYKDVTESVMETKTSEFYIDKYGNYSPITEVLFGGDLGSQRVGDALPLDYGL